MVNIRIGRDYAVLEEGVHTLQVTLSRRLSFKIGFWRPLSYEKFQEKYVNKPRGVLDGYPMPLNFKSQVNLKDIR